MAKCVGDHRVKCRPCREKGQSLQLPEDSVREGGCGGVGFMVAAKSTPFLTTSAQNLASCANNLITNYTSELRRALISASCNFLPPDNASDDRLMAVARSSRSLTALRHCEYAQTDSLSRSERALGSFDRVEIYCFPACLSL